mgnify:CR=1 FL=1
MNPQHRDLANGKWVKMSLAEQMANIGSEVERAINWKNKNNKNYSYLALTRALELIDLTIAYTQSLSRLREFTRMRELLVEYFIGPNIYKSSDLLWHKYFYPFNFAARSQTNL